MAQLSKKHRTVNFLGGIGYISVIFQWLWTGIIFLPTLLENDTFKNLFLPPEPSSTPTPQPQATDETSLIVIIIGIIVTVIVLSLTILILIRLPKAVATAGKTTTTSVARAVAPAVSHHKKLSPKKEKLLTANLVRIIKYIAVVLPTLLLFFVYVVNVELSHTIVLIIGATLGLGSFTWFTLEYVLARLFAIPIEDIF